MDVAESEKVISYLKEINVQEEVLSNFMREKMDCHTVRHATDEQLKRIGFMEGDLIRLRIFCQDKSTQSAKERKKELKQFIENGERLPKKLKVSKFDKKQKPKSKMVYITWENFDDKKKRYAQVKASTGGGCRKITFDEDSTKNDMLQVCMDMFWNNRKPGIFKSFDSYHFILADFKKEVIPDVLKNNSEDEVPFTVGSYCQSNQMTRPRIYFLSKLKSWNTHMRELAVKAIDISSDSDFEVDLPATGLNTVSHLLHSTPLSQSDSMLVNSSLIGTTEERSLLQNEIDSAFRESESADRLKEQTQAAEESKRQRLRDLMFERGNRVEPEPNLSEDHATITIRHVTLGNKTRLFKGDSKMLQVYDWVGSLNDEPEHFSLLNFQQQAVTPDETINSGVYNMVVTDKPILMTPSGSVAFRGFGTQGPFPISKEYDKLEMLRKEAHDKLSGTTDQVVDRDNIYDDFIRMYSNNDIDTKDIHIAFRGETGLGDGVTRDAFSTFFNKMGAKFQGETEWVPLPTIESMELEIIGRIITHAFLTQKIFPVHICQSSLQHILFKEVSNDELFHSFLNFLPPCEGTLIQLFKEGKSSDKQAILDILCDSQIYTTPTPDNIYDLCCKAARICLVRLPFLALQSIIDGMGRFWNDVSSVMLASIYKCTVPTAEKLISCLDVNEVKHVDQKITTWLHRYIRSCTKIELLVLVRFITGASTFSPTDIIKVQFVEQPFDHLHPGAATCFKVLMLPRQYGSFTQFRENITMHVSSNNWNLHDEQVIDI